MEIDNLTLGQKIKDIRLQCGDTQEEFAKRIGNGRGSKATINNYEKGRNKPSASRLKKIAEIGNTTVADLLRNNNPIETKEAQKKPRRRLATMHKTFGESRIRGIYDINDLRGQLETCQGILSEIQRELKNKTENDLKLESTENSKIYEEMDMIEFDETEFLFNSISEYLEAALDAYHYFCHYGDK